tara:strand:+ start:292 stop:495 length:204 start_codon:yes stop_codon:yes gene_type:complete
MNNPPAFPHGDPTHGGELGMTLRDYMAAKAMQGFMYGAPTNDDINDALGNLAAMSFKLADAMLKARE